MRAPIRFGLVEMCVTVCLIGLLAILLRAGLSAVDRFAPRKSTDWRVTATSFADAFDMEVKQLKLKVLSVGRTKDALKISYALENPDRERIDHVTQGSIRAVLFDSTNRQLVAKGETALELSSGFQRRETARIESILTVSIPPEAKSLLLEATFVFGKGMFKSTLHSDVVAIPGPPIASDERR